MGGPEGEMRDRKRNLPDDDGAVAGREIIAINPGEDKHCGRPR